MAPRGIDPGPFRKFAEFVAEIKPKHIGRDIAGNSKNYVPLSALRDYWTPRRISSVLHAFPGRLDIDVSIIKRHYLRIFSTLVYTDPDAARNLQPLFMRYNLNDSRLPLRSRPSEWADEKFFRDFFKQIACHQWQFFPLHFDPDQLHDRHLDDECILPIEPPTQIPNSNATLIERFDIHEEFNHLAPRDEQGRPTKKTFVFKIYHNKKNEDQYENELRALRRLSVNPSSNVVKFHGSVRQFGSYCLILEYVDGGNLGEFFDTYPPPSTVEDVAMFWKSIFQVFWGLDRIHQLRSYNDDEMIKGIHQDIRPENILLMKGPSGSPYDFTPKIADFGLYSRVRTAKLRSSGSMGLDRYGTQRFSAPECCHHTVQRLKATNMITTSADIFSIGAVLSHCAAWVIGGLEGQKAYFRLRSVYHATKLLRFKDSGYEGCFHDSIDPLPVVKDQHEKLRGRCKVCGDDITPEILNCIEGYMLIQKPKDRYKAKDILEKFQQFMDRRIAPPPATPTSPATPVSGPPTGDSEETVQSPMWSDQAASPTTVDDTMPGLGADTVCPLSSLQSHALPASVQGATPTKAPPLPRDSSQSTVSTVESTPVQSSIHTRDIPSNLPTQQAGPTSANPSSPSPVITKGPSISDIYKFYQGDAVDQATEDLVHYLEHNLGGRDQLFFIDDSRSMLADKDIIYDGFRALASIAKRLGPNDVELAFASQPRKVYKARRMKKLQKLVKKCQYQGHGHLMEDRFGELINSVIIPKLPYRILGVNVNIFARKKVSIYVFTDGDWGDEKDSHNACGVETPVKRLIEELKSRRLDRTQVSLHFVRFGDKENGRKHLERLDECGRAVDMDIVDVKHINSEAERLILGPLTRSNDDIPGG